MAGRVLESGWSLVASPILFAEVVGLHAASRAGVETAARMFQDAWIANLSRPGRGPTSVPWYDHYMRTIRRGNKVWVAPVARRKIPHRPSLPGEPPAPDTGRGRLSIQMRETGSVATRGVEFIVFTEFRYLAYLEYGVGRPAGLFGPHPGGITILPRPHARPALRATLPKMPAGVGITARSVMAERALVIRTKELTIGIRHALIAISNQIGWLNSLGLSPPMLNAVRGMAIRTQRGLADMTALSEQKFGARLVRRAVGRIAGRSIGTATRGMLPRGGSGARFGQRIIRNQLGRSVGPYIRNIRG